MEGTASTYSCRTFIHNWFEERIYQHDLATNSVNVRLNQLSRQINNMNAITLMSPKDSKYVLYGDSFILVNHNESAKCLAIDPRINIEIERSTLGSENVQDPLKSFAVSLTPKLASSRRTVLTVVPVTNIEPVIAKYGNKREYNFTKEDLEQICKTYIEANRLENVFNPNGLNEQPLRYGDRINLLVQPALIGEHIASLSYEEKSSTVDKNNEKYTYALCCSRPTSYVSGGMDPTLCIANLKTHLREAEFIVDAFDVSRRAESVGMPIGYDEPVVLRSCATGECLGTIKRGQTSEVPIKTDMGVETKLFASTLLDQQKQECRSNLFSFSVGGK